MSADVSLGGVPGLIRPNKKASTRGCLYSVSQTARESVKCHTGGIWVVLLQKLWHATVRWWGLGRAQPRVELPFP